ncbi:MAG: hypothetical protein QF787_17535, partial [Nitrospinota bacterium]|nr:hypothetical protein [Nitrospinota bacterium]
MDGYDVDRRVFEEWRELVAVSTISWPENPPAALGDVDWTGPQPYVHIHMGTSKNRLTSPDFVLSQHFSHNSYP